MKTISYIYPSLGKYFANITDLANAACVSRTHTYECLKGDKQFTPQQKKAIVADIITRITRGDRWDEVDERDLPRLFEAYCNFDEVFRSEVNKHESIPTSGNSTGYIS
jgi:hypothetical protein